MKYKWTIVLINLLLLLVYFNYSICNKEKILSKGTLVLLKLAPVDPRSLMQGDYMDLRYAIADELRDKLLYDSIPDAKRGYCVVKIDKDGVAGLIRTQESKEPAKEGEYLILYNIYDYKVTFGAESYFFQEGTAEKFEKAEYGGLRVDNNGNNVLVGLYDENKKLIK